MARKLKRRGIMFITSVIALAVMFVTGTLFMGLSSQVFNDARRDLHSLHAIALADAGVQYLLAQEAQAPLASVRAGDGVQARLLDTDSGMAPDYQIALDEGNAERFAVWLLTVPGDDSVYQVISRGYFRSGRPMQYSRVVRALIDKGSTTEATPEDPPPVPVTPDLLPMMFDYAFFCDEGLDIKSQSYIGGKVGSNGNINLKAKSTVTGGAYVATGHVVSRNKNATLGGTVVTGPRLDLPKVDFNRYRKYAEDNGGLVVNDNWSPPANFTFPECGVVYVHGDVNISSWTTFTGAGTIVATGGMHISSHVSSNLQDSSILMIAGDDVQITAQVSIDATIYTLGCYRQTAHVDLRGAIISKRDNSFTTAHSAITYRKVDDDSPYIPPGDDTETGGNGEGATTRDLWGIRSWEQF